jgi:hypothetical protein
MFSELPKLFDRDFAVGFFLPAAALVASFWVVLRTFGVTGTTLGDLESWTATAIAIGVVWLVAVGLLAFNYAILRFLEGYPKFFPLRRERERFWKKRFRNAAEQNLLVQATIDRALDEAKDPPTTPGDFPQKLRLAVEEYPHEIAFVLPTKFGNVFRSLEAYPLVVYGIDAIPAWPRLQAVLPEKFKTQLGEAKSLLDFFVNIVVGGVLTGWLYILLGIWTRDLPSLWLPVVAIAVVFGSYNASLVAVKEYGIHVKCAFDLYRGELAKQLGLELPRSPAAERRMWVAVSTMMIYRSTRYADQLGRFRAPEVPGSVD